MRVYVVRRWLLRGRRRFVCWNITRVSPWLLYNVHFVQSTQRTRLQTRPFVCGIYNLLKLGVCASRKHPCWSVCRKNLNFVSMCAVSPVVHTSNISSCLKKLFHISCCYRQFHEVRSFGFLVINVCNHGEHYETPCINYWTARPFRAVFLYSFNRIVGIYTTTVDHLRNMNFLWTLIIKPTRCTNFSNLFLE